MQDTQEIGQKLATLEASAKEKFEDVKEAAAGFSFSEQQDKHPWSFFLGAIGTGFVIGSLLAHSSDEEPLAAAGRSYQFKPAAAREERHSLLHDGMALAASSGIAKVINDTLGSEMKEAKKWAIGTALGVVRELARDKIPASMADKASDVFDKLTRSLGGEPIKGRLFSSEPQPA